MTPEQLRALFKKEVAAVKRGRELGPALGVTPPEFQPVGGETLKQLGEPPREVVHGFQVEPPWVTEKRKPEPGEVASHTAFLKKQIVQYREAVYHRELDKAYTEGAGKVFGKVLGKTGVNIDRFATFMALGMRDYMTWYALPESMKLPPVSSQDRIASGAGMILGIVLFGKILGTALHPFGIASKASGTLLTVARKLPVTKNLFGLISKSKYAPQIMQLIESSLTFSTRGGMMEMVQQVKSGKYSALDIGKSMAENSVTGAWWGALGLPQGYYRQIMGSFIGGATLGKMYGEPTIEALINGGMFAALAAAEGPRRHRVKMQRQAFALLYKPMEKYIKHHFPKAGPSEIAARTLQAVGYTMKQATDAKGKLNLMKVQELRADAVRAMTREALGLPKLKGKEAGLAAKRKSAMHRYIMGAVAGGQDLESTLKNMRRSGVEVVETSAPTPYAVTIPAVKGVKAPIKNFSWSSKVKAPAAAKKAIEARISSAMAGIPALGLLTKKFGFTPKIVIKGALARKVIKNLGGITAAIHPPKTIMGQYVEAAEPTINKFLGFISGAKAPTLRSWKMIFEGGLPKQLLKNWYKPWLTMAHEYGHGAWRRMTAEQQATYKKLGDKYPVLKKIAYKPDPAESFAELIGFTTLQPKVIKKAFPDAYKFLAKEVFGVKEIPGPRKPDFVVTTPEQVRYLKIGRIKILPRRGEEVVGYHYTEAAITKKKLQPKKAVTTAGELPVTWFYSQKAVTEKKVPEKFKVMEKVYAANLVGLYNLDRDPMGLMAKAKGDVAKLKRLMKTAGFRGWMQDGGTVAASFYPVKAKPGVVGREKLRFNTPTQVSTFLSNKTLRQDKLAGEVGIIYSAYQEGGMEKLNRARHSKEGRWLGKEILSYIPLDGKLSGKQEQSYLVTAGPKTLGKMLDRAFNIHKQKTVTLLAPDGQVYLLYSNGFAEQSADPFARVGRFTDDYRTVQTPGGEVSFKFGLYATSPKPIEKFVWLSSAIKEYLPKMHLAPARVANSQYEPALTGGKDKDNKLTGLWKHLHENPPPEVLRDLDHAITTWFGEYNLGAYKGITESEGFNKRIGKKRRDIMDRYIENPKKYAGKLTETEKIIAGDIRKTMDKLWMIANDAGILDSYIDNYIPHLYKDPSKKVATWLGTRLKTKPAFAKRRKYPTSEEAEAAGLHPIRDPALKIQVYAQALYRAMANKRLITTLKVMRNEEGNQVLLPAREVAKRGLTYKWLNIPALSSLLGYKGKEGKTVMFKQPVMADPKIANTLKDIFSPFTPAGQWRRGYIKVRGGIKRLIMYNPLIHGTNILSDILDEASFNPMKTVRIFKRGAELWKKRDAQIERLLRAGLNLSGVSQTAHELRDKLLPRHIESKYLGKLDKFREWNDRILWNGIVRSAQIGLWEMKVKELTGRGASQANADRAAAAYVNNMLGTLPHIWMTRMERGALGTLFFARNWTVSNIRLVTGVLGVKSQYKFKVKGKEVGLPNFLTHKGLPGELEPLRKHYAFHLVKGVAGLFVFTNLMQMGMQKMAGKDPHPTWENETGHWLDIDTGVLDKKLRKIYIKPHLFRYISDILGWAYDPRKTFYNKMEPLLKLSWEMIANYSGFRKRPIAPRGAPWMERRLKELEYLVKSITPAGYIKGRPGEVRGWLESIVPITGTWIRHGVAPMLDKRWEWLSKKDKVAFLKSLGKEDSKKFYLAMLGKKKVPHNVRADWAVKLLEFMTKTRYKKENIDREIDVLIQKEQIADALRLMIQTRRYQTTKGMMERLMKFREGGEEE